MIGHERPSWWFLTASRKNGEPAKAEAKVEEWRTRGADAANDPKALARAEK